MKTRSEVIGEALAHARAGLAVAIVSDTGRQTVELMGMLHDEVPDASRVVRVHGAEEVRFPSGGRLRLYSQRQIDRMRGCSYDRVYVDVMPMTLCAAGVAGTVEAFA